MYKSRLHKVTIIIGIIFCLLVPVACSQPEVQETAQPEGGFVKIAPGAYDSADTAIVIAKQEKQKKITFFNLEKQKNYTLNYDEKVHLPILIDDIALRYEAEDKEMLIAILHDKDRLIERLWFELKATREQEELCREYIEELNK